jgi:hypothetical protein
MPPNPGTAPFIFLKEGKGGGDNAEEGMKNKRCFALARKFFLAAIAGY